MESYLQNFHHHLNYKITTVLKLFFENTKSNHYSSHRETKFIRINYIAKKKKNILNAYLKAPVVSKFLYKWFIEKLKIDYDAHLNIILKMLKISTSNVILNISKLAKHIEIILILDSDSSIGYYFFFFKRKEKL